AFPNLQISTSPISFGPHVTWTPSLAYPSSQSLHIDQPGPFQSHYFINAQGALDSATIKKSSYTTGFSLATPLKIFSQEIGNAFRFNSQRTAFPDLFTLHDVTTGDSVGVRIYSESFQNQVDWTPTFQLPPLGQNRFNLSPVIGLANVDPGPYWVATERTNGRYVAQGKRLSY